MYYIELPETSAQVVNGHGVAYNLSTYHGPADLRTMTAAEVLAQIIDPCLQQGPITLKNVDFNLAAANIDKTKHHDLLNTKIQTLGFTQICAAMFMTNSAHDTGVVSEGKRREIAHRNRKSDSLVSGCRKVKPKIVLVT